MGKASFSGNWSVFSFIVAHGRLLSSMKWDISVLSFRAGMGQSRHFARARKPCSHDHLCPPANM